MSTFCGYFEDLKYVSVDRFDGSQNLSSKVYFLSHCHTDHMIGLDNKSFQERLLNNGDIFLYASPVSVRILTGLYPDLVHKFKCVPLKDSMLIVIPENEKFLTVTAIPAGHCPGSVMFLFESDKNILYTGDIRLNAIDLGKYKTLFHQSDNVKKVVDLMYLDTTFFSPAYSKFPDRSESLKSLMQLVEDWISLGPNYVINLITSAKYGHEYLFSELSKGLKMPIHVNEEIFNVYKHIPDMDNVITRDGKLTKIHACCKGYINKQHKICVGNPAEKNDIGKSVLYKVRKIKTSAMYFENFKEEGKVVEFDRKSDLFRVCYSCHSSYEELVDFIKFFEPTQIKASVLPETSQEQEQLFHNLNEVLSKLNISENLNSEICESNMATSVDLFDLSIVSKTCDEDKHTSTESNDNFLLDSPPQSRKRLRF